MLFMYTIGHINVILNTQYELQDCPQNTFVKYQMWTLVGVFMEHIPCICKFLNNIIPRLCMKYKLVSFPTH